jgi:hypothetical protein
MTITAGTYATAPTLTTSESWQWAHQPVSSPRRKPRRLLTEPIVGTLTLPCSEVIFEVTQPEPSWFYPAMSRFQHLSRLADNWDTYGGSRVSDDAIYTALSIIARLLRDQSVPPAIVPTSQGGVQLEWHRVGDEVEVRVTPTGEISAFRCNEGDGKIDEIEKISLADLSPLVELVGQV